MPYSALDIAPLSPLAYQARMFGLEELLVIALSYVLWRYFQSPKSPLDLIRGPQRSSWIRGNLPELLGKTGWEYHNEEAARQYGGIFKAYLFLKMPILYVSDPKALHHVLVKDLHVYEKTNDSLNFSNLSFGPGLLSKQGTQHRKQRKILNPVFNIAHLRDITPIFYDVAYKVRDALAKQVPSGGSNEVDILPWATRGTLELAGQGILGHSFESLTEENNMGAYATSLKNLLPVWMTFTFARLVILPWVKDIGTPEFRRRVVDTIPWKRLHSLRDMSDLLTNTSTQVYNAKKAAFESEKPGTRSEDGLKGREILTSIMRANELADEEDRLTDSEITAQISTFTFAGMDSTSNALGMILHLLSQRQETQDILRHEIIEPRKHVGDLNYDDLNALPYLDAVIRETLRLHPPSPNIVRVARQDIVLPVSKPLLSTENETMNEVLVPKDTMIMCSLFLCNRNPEIWGADSREWKPERWLRPLPDSVRDADISGVYSNLMTFSAGNRACIGFKFAQLELKVLLIILLESFKFSPAEKDIVWEMHGTIHPVVRGEEPGNSTDKQEIPLGLPLVLSPLT